MFLSWEEGGWSIAWQQLLLTPLSGLIKTNATRFAIRIRKGLVSKFQEEKKHWLKYHTCRYYYWIKEFWYLILKTHPRNPPVTKGENICLMTTTADGFFLTITLSLRCHMKPQRTWRTSQTKIETSSHFFFNILKVQSQSTGEFTSQRGKVFKYHITDVRQARFQVSRMTSILTGEPKLLDLEVITWYLFQRYCICPSHHDSAHGRSKHLW